jgi:hypothetical protein
VKAAKWEPSMNLRFLILVRGPVREDWSAVGYWHQNVSDLVEVR